MKTAQGGRMTGIRFFLFFMMVLFLQIAGPMEAHAAGKAVFPKKATVVVGESATLKFTGKAKKITYSTGNSKVVKILKKKKTGVVIQAKSAGTVKITAKAGGKKYVCVVTSSPIAPELSLKVGETKKLRLFGAGGTAKWSIRKSALRVCCICHRSSRTAPACLMTGSSSMTAMRRSLRSRGPSSIRGTGITIYSRRREA